MNKRLRIVFMGTPEFAVESLDKLYHSRHEIVAAVTAPDKPAGRGGKLRTSAVKDFCEANDIPVWQPTNLKDPSFIDQLKDAQPDLIVVVAFRMLPEVVWKLPPMGTINLHASLLPDYRGAAPINWAIINGEKETGVTTFFINENIDTGDVIDQQKVAINENMNAGALHDLLKTTGANVLLKTVDAIADDTIQAVSQQNMEEADSAPLAPKIDRINSKIDWHQPAEKVLNLIRGMSPYPGAFTINTADESMVKIFKASRSDHKLTPGEIRISKNKFEVGTATDAVCVEEIQSPGKKRMQIADFLNGVNAEMFKMFI